MKRWQGIVPKMEWPETGQSGKTKTNFTETIRNWSQTDNRYSGWNAKNIRLKKFSQEPALDSCTGKCCARTS